MLKKTIIKEQELGMRKKMLKEEEKRVQEDLLAHSSIMLSSLDWSVYISASADVINRAD